ncbi:Hypothetical protein PHPALM_14187 [Phytophthora palmivora]|uniref:Uncharacterized protein n=1 Tax=Phytophthora palmivora TaxID=4796 RepID=A0A2P4XVE2_9STRA|nr:Hypothetical protein PHPALM_14187 [Phytophthora palmivora]
MVGTLSSSKSDGVAAVIVTSGICGVSCVELNGRHNDLPEFRQSGATGSFLLGWSLPAVFSCDKGVLPSTSKRNTTHMFMPDRPHRYGSKLYMLRDSRTAYCHSYAMYTGERDDGDKHLIVGQELRQSSGYAKRAPDTHGTLSSSIDSIPSSFAVELLKMGVYVIVTIMADRLGYAAHIVDKRKTRPASISRGTSLFLTLCLCRRW